MMDLVVSEILFKRIFEIVLFVYYLVSDDIMMNTFFFKLIFIVLFNSCQNFINNII